MKIFGRTFQKCDIISDSIVQLYQVTHQRLNNFSNGKKLVILEDCKFRQINNQKEIYIKLNKFSYQICFFDKDFANIKILRSQYFSKLDYDHICTGLQTTNGLIMLLRFNNMLLIRSNKIIQKIRPQCFKILNQKILQQLPYLFQPQDLNDKFCSVIYEQIIDKFKQYFKIKKEPPQTDYQIKTHNDIFVLKRFKNDQFLHLAEFSSLQNNQGMIKRIIIYENDLFLDLTIIQEIINLDYIKFMMSLSQKTSQYIPMMIRTTQMHNYIKNGQLQVVKELQELRQLYDYAYFQYYNNIIIKKIVKFESTFIIFKQKSVSQIDLNFHIKQRIQVQKFRKLEQHQFIFQTNYQSFMQQEINNQNQIDSNSGQFNESLAQDEFICSYMNQNDDNHVICQLCFKKLLFDYCLQCQLLSLKNEVYKPQTLQTNARTRIDNEINFIRNNEIQNIKLFQIQLEGGTISKKSYLIFMKGRENTFLENGIYPFLILYPTKYPFEPFIMKSLFHYYNPKIQKNQQLFIKFNTIQNVQTKTLYEMVIEHYENIHSNVHNVHNNQDNINNNALDENIEIKNIYDDKFIQMQAKYFSFQNPIYQKWQLEQNWNQSQDQPIKI
ncbi:Ubiquitin-conjugating enzyme E2 U [Paramecium bursaria]